ncbi:MAG: glycosyltransferase [Leptospiraceae bacterium]|nr:glycosyltransferase [Leptospiraceae bacterium]
MKITILNTNDISGGAARAMYRLHKGLKLLGEDSRVFCKKKQSTDLNVFEIEDTNNDVSEEKVLSTLAQEYFNYNRTEISNTIFSYPYPDYQFPQTLIDDTDIFNLHWVSYFLSPNSISKLLDSGKPVVWTLHDEWPFTGGCHYTAGCLKFIDDCSSCPQIKSIDSKLPKQVLAEKIASFQNRLTIITPSHWLAQRARKSKLFKDSRIEVIPNSIELDLFKATIKTEAKAELEIPIDSFAILFGAENGNEKRKGFHHLIDALNILKSNESWKEAKVHILVLGNPSDEIVQLGINYTSFGNVKDDLLISKIYSAADVYVLPSIEDNLPNTMLESLACETSVIAFETGGIIDVVLENQTGYLAKLNDSKSLAQKILESYLDESKRKELGKTGRLKIEKEFGLEIQAKRYKNLFRELLEKNHKQKNFDLTKLEKTISNSDFLKSNEVKDEISQGLLFPYYDIKTKKDELQNQFNELQNRFHDLEMDHLRLFKILYNKRLKVEIYFAFDGVYDYTKPKFFELDVSQEQEYSEFLLKINLSLEEHYDKKVTEITIIPAWKNSFVLELNEISTDSKYLIDLESIKGNWQKREENKLFYYNGHGLLIVPIPKIGLEASVNGKIKLLSTWEGFAAFQSLLDDKENKIQELQRTFANRILRFLYRLLKK